MRSQRRRPPTVVACLQLGVGLLLLPARRRHHCGQPELERARLCPYRFPLAATSGGRAVAAALGRTLAAATATGARLLSTRPLTPAAATAAAAPPASTVRAPPATPPPPPVIVRATFVLAAEVSTFDVEAFRVDLLRRVPGARSVTLAIAPASVVVEALFLMRSHLEAAAAIEVISGASAEEMSEAWFGGRVAVEAAPTVVEEAYSPAAIGPLATEGSAAQRAAKGDGSQGRVDATSFALGAAAIAAIAAFVLALVRWRAIATRRPPGGCVSVGSSMTVGAEYSLSDPLPTATVGWGWNWHIGTTNSGKQQASPRTVWRKATASPVMARVGAASSSASPAACAPMAEDGATLPPYCFPCVSPEISSSTAPTIMGPADAVGQQNAL